MKKIAIPAAVALLALTACSAEADADAAEAIGEPTAIETTAAAEVEETEAEPEVADRIEFEVTRDTFGDYTEPAREVEVTIADRAAGGTYEMKKVFESVTLTADESSECGITAQYELVDENVQAYLTDDERDVTGGDRNSYNVADIAENGGEYTYVDCVASIHFPELEDVDLGGVELRSAAYLEAVRTPGTDQIKVGMSIMQ